MDAKLPVQAWAELGARTGNRIVVRGSFFLSYPVMRPFKTPLRWMGPVSSRGWRDSPHCFTAGRRLAVWILRNTVKVPPPSPFSSYWQGVPSPPRSYLGRDRRPGNSLRNEIQGETKKKELNIIGSDSLPFHYKHNKLIECFVIFLYKLFIASCFFFLH